MEWAETLMQKESLSIFCSEKRLIKNRACLIMKPIL